jgi:hypothetical protein
MLFCHLARAPMKLISDSVTGGGRGAQMPH